MARRSPLRCSAGSMRWAWRCAAVSAGCCRDHNFAATAPINAQSARNVGAVAVQIGVGGRRWRNTLADRVLKRVVTWLGCDRRARSGVDAAVLDALLLRVLC